MVPTHNTLVRHVFVAAVCCAAIGSAHAATATASAGTPFVLSGSTYSLTGSDTLAFSAAKISNDSLGHISNVAIAPAVYDAVLGTFSSAISQVTLDNATGTIQGFSAPGGFTETGAAQAGLLTGGALSVSNMSYDAATKTIYADVHGIGTVAGDLGTINQMAVFKVTTAAGTTSIAGPGTYTTTLSGLFATTTALNYVSQSFGFTSFTTGVVQGLDFGTVTANLSVVKASPVPESSTWLQMAMGLISLIMTLRRKMAVQS